MAVVIETTLGDITVDLYLDRRPATCLNFLKLCKMKYYNFNLFHTIRSGFIAQTGDPAGEGSGGDSIWGLLEGSEKRFFSGEKMPKIRHTQAGLLSMVCTGDMMVGSQFFFTLGADLDSLDGVHCVIGEVSEGHEVLRKLNEVICDETHRPYQDVRITHTVILEDPFSDPSGLRAPSRSPSPSVERLKGGRIAPDEELDETQGKTIEEIQEMIEEKEAKARATILEIVGDLPDADIAPPENVLFVCKLNPVTTDEDLEIIFSRFGKIVSCEVIRDKKSGDSLQYAFIEFSDKKSCEDAYFKMDNVLIDDRRIHVDFSQSVSKIKWLGKGRGVKHMDDENSEHNIKSETNHRKQEDSRNNHYREKYKQHDRDTYRDKDRYNRPEKEIRSHRTHRERSRSKTRHDSSKNKSSRFEKHSQNYEKNNRDDSNHNTYVNTSRNNQPKSKSRREESESISKDKKEKSPPPSKDRHEKSKRKSVSSPRRDRYKKSPTKSNIQLSPSRDKYYSENRENKNSNLKINDIQSNKRKHAAEPDTSSKKSRHGDNNLKALTPSPIIEKNKQKNGSEITKQKEKKHKRTKTLKKKRKPSTSTSESSSSDTSSSTSSTSSTDTSSSSASDRKKSSKRKRKKYSSSSSSTDSSTTSSSDTDSDTSSSTDSDRRKKNKHKKSIKKKVAKKPKRKS